MKYRVKEVYKIENKLNITLYKDQIFKYYQLQKSEDGENFTDCDPSLFKSIHSTLFTSISRARKWVIKKNKLEKELEEKNKNIKYHNI